MRFEVEFVETDNGWGALGQIDKHLFDIWANSLPSCIRAVASIVEENLRPKYPNRQRVVYNEH